MIQPRREIRPFLFTIIILLNTTLYGESVYKSRPEDPAAVYLTPENYDVTPDAPADDSDALQAAINAVEEKAKFGIVYIPAGEYQLTRPVHVWKGIRLIGYGQTRPRFVLEPHTSGYEGDESVYMIHFVSNRPREGRPIRDANPGTFYSAISNIDFKIGGGNPAAVAVRSHYAQHCFIAHVDFFIGDGKAGVEEVGNEIEDCRFIGGDYGIITTKPSPNWPFLMIDTMFKGQRQAAISTEEAGLTLVRNQFVDVPHAVVVNPDRAEELFIIDSRFDRISKAAVVISDEYNARPQFNFKNIVCHETPVLARFRKSGKRIEAPADLYRVDDFSHGMQMHDLGAVPEVKTTVDMEPLKKMPAPVASDIPELPDVKDWVNLRDLGAAGDGVTDDTEVIRQAVQEHRVIFVPTGRYLVSETIKLRPNSVLIGMNPITTQLVLADDLDAFAGPGSPNALLETAKGGEAIVISIGLDTGAFNERAVAAKWMAGERSYMNDVRFVGGHGTYHPDGSHVPVYNKFRSGDPYRDRDWDTQYSSLWITDGGGGTFKDIWTPNSFAQAGLYISDTDTPGRIYAMSLEHHVRNEVMLRNVSNWRFFVMQMEEESAEGRHALPVWIQNCENLLFANTYLYRVIRMNSPYPQGILVNSSKNIEFCGLHVYSPTVYSFNTTLYDQTHGVEVRQRELARLTLSGNPPTQPQDEPAASAVLANGAKVEKVIDGFEFITGATADQEGNVYFVDSRCHHIYKWSPEEQNVSLIRNTPLSPVALGLDESGNLLVTTRDRHVVAFDPDQNGEQLQVLEPVDPDQHNAPIALIPGHMWRDEHDFLDITTYSEDNPPTTHSSFTIAHRLDSNPLKNHYVSPDNGVFIPEWQGLVRSVSLRRAVPGQPFYMADEFGQKTYKFKVNKNGLLTDPELFAERGELDVSVDNEGNVYIPAGDVYVYNPDGEQIDVIRVPERPATLVFGGKNRDTLYITARTSLYKIKTRTRGRVLE